ncbi:MAG: iron-containing alcohol dehydrogenase [Clostridiales bacterium]|nr:iron-containing alcohol dehydrogenase [Clostridiales bacterium]
MNNFEFYSPTKVIFGKDVEQQVGAEIKKWGGNKVLVHYGGSSAKQSGLLDRVEAALKEENLKYVLLGGVEPNPRISLVRAGIDLCRKENVDFILAVGGGSVLDSAKAIALGVPYEGDVWDFYDRKASPSEALPHGNIITLAATGSETSSSSVITKEENGLKRGCNTELNRPKFTLMNPELLYTLPPYQTACGIVDIMMHTLDRYFSPGGINEITDRIAEALLQTVIQYGTVCMKDPYNYEARSEIFWAGSLSHNHLTGLGRMGDWAVHQMEHELSGMFDVAHGAGLSAIWEAWALYVYKEDIMRFARYGANVWKLNLNYENPEETALAAIQATKDYFSSLGMPISIPQLLGKKATDEEMREMAVKCTFFGKRTIGGIKILGEEDIYNIYQGANK